MRLGRGTKIRWRALQRRFGTTRFAPMRALRFLSVLPTCAAVKSAYLTTMTSALRRLWQVLACRHSLRLLRYLTPTRAVMRPIGTADILAIPRCFRCFKARFPVTLWWSISTRCTEKNCPYLRRPSKTELMRSASIRPCFGNYVQLNLCSGCWVIERSVKAR